MTDLPLTPGPDVSVRVGWADDAPGVAAVQVAAWRQEYDGVLPVEVLESFDPEQFAAAWHQAMSRPADARNRVLVAVKNAPSDIAVRAVAGETRRLIVAVMDHMVRRVARFRFPRYEEPQLRWKVWSSMMSHLPHVLAHRWREPIAVRRESMRQWESPR